MMKRALSALLFVAASALGVAALVDCGGSSEPGSEPGADGATATSSGGGGGGSGSNGASGEPGTSSGASGGNGSSGDPPPDPPKRIETKVGLPKRSAGCGNAAPPPDATRRAIADGRTYLPYKAANYSANGVDATAGYPVLVALHGCYGTPEGLAGPNFMHLQDYVGAEGIVVYGNDVGNGDVEGDAYGCNWDAFGGGDVAYLDNLIADVAAQYCVDESRVFLLGFSWGAYMAHNYACNHPGTIKAVVGAAGGYPDGAPGTDPAVCGQIPSLVYGRTADQDEYQSKFHNARDKRKAVASCAGGDSAAYWPFNADRNDPPPQFENAKGCTDTSDCVGGLRTTFCEDPYDLLDLGPPADPTWNHTFWDPYRRPVWEWLRNLP